MRIWWGDITMIKLDKAVDGELEEKITARGRFGSDFKVHYLNSD